MASSLADNIFLVFLVYQGSDREKKSPVERAFSLPLPFTSSLFIKPTRPPKKPVVGRAWRKSVNEAALVAASYFTS
jgi:hypothetical protein